MARLFEYSTNPDENTTIGGLSVAEGSTSLAALNNVQRQTAADIAKLDEKLDNIPIGIPKAGGEFLGNVTRKDFGGYYLANDPTQVAPRIYVLPEGAPAPTAPPSGSLLIYHAP